MKTYTVTRLALLTAMSLALGWAESLVPSPPGMKLGLSNIVLLYALYLLGTRSAVYLMFLKVILSGFTYAGINAMMFSLGGGMCSLIMMALVKKLGGKRVSLISVSVVGAVFHNIGQLVVMAIILNWRTAIVLVPMLFFSGILMGAITGVVAHYTISALSKMDSGSMQEPYMGRLDK